MATPKKPKPEDFFIETRPKDPSSYGFEEFVSRILRVPKKTVDGLKVKERRRNKLEKGKK